MSTLLARAFALAVEAHAGQADKIGMPYIHHPLRVAGIVSLLPTPCATTRELAVAAAVLHDVIEHTDVTLANVRAVCGPDVAEIVKILTRRDGESYDNYITRICAAQHPLALAVKMADLRDNLDLRRSMGISADNSLRYRSALRTLQTAAPC